MLVCYFVVCFVGWLGWLVVDCYLLVIVLVWISLLL